MRWLFSVSGPFFPIGHVQPSGQQDSACDMSKTELIALANVTPPHGFLLSLHVLQDKVDSTYDHGAFYVFKILAAWI